ncbi:cilia- and flagella-associated protein 206-like [Phlebotomus argentipes]|uniref:cilia- and flagella-associated protein 206-like n=1 Tax=Phlebotomus argentipes TaxID=94469 RepID=UPI0028934023|nr:cilia- and flagella-associated protein 206-like [Phlebotomus argentipes]
MSSLARAILEECVRQDVLVDDDFVAFYVTSLATETEEVGRIVDFLADKRRPALITLKMQFYVTENPVAVERIKQKHRDVVKQKTSRLSREILEGCPKSKEERAKLLRRIVVDLVVNNSIGSPANEKVLEETESALKSVISESDVTTFASLRRVDKIRTLEDLRRIVCGIRVFNSDAGHCGEGIVNLAEIVEKSLETTISLLKGSLEATKKRSHIYFSFLSSCLTTKGIKLPSSCSAELFDILKEIGILSVQHEHFLISIHGLVVAFKFDVFQILDSFKNLLRSIHEKVKYRTAIPTDEIYPKFKDLGVLWLELQDCVHVLSEVNLMNDNLAFLADRTGSYDEIVLGMLPESAEEDQNGDSAEKISIPCHLKDFRIVDSIPREKITYSGFCPWALSHGILLPGNESLGIIQFQESINYSFYSRDFAETALSKMRSIEKKISQEVASNSQLKILLDFQSKSWKPDTEKLAKNVRIDQEMQTELHPIPSFFDRSHSSRRRDKDMKCHSTQTLRESCTQTIEVEDKNVQTN